MRKKRYQTPGAAPGTLTPLAGALVPKSIHVIHYTADSIEEVDVTRAGDVQPFRDRKGVTWVNVDGLGDVDLISGLGALFGLHPLALEDVLNLPQRPKVDDYEDHLFLVLGMLHFEAKLQCEQVSLFLGPRFVLTFQEDVGDCLDPIRERLRKGTGQLRRQGADYLMYCILDAVLDNYFPFLERLGERVEALEDEVVEDPTRQTLGRVHEVKRELLDVRRSVWPLREVANALARDERSLVNKSTRLYLRDCYDHAVQILDMVETYRELGAGLMDVYLSSVSNKLNQVMKVLTVIATIFMPLTFLAGVYGMNFHYFPEIHWRWGYLAFWIAILIMVVLMLWLFRRKGWLGKTSEEEPK